MIDLQQALVQSGSEHFRSDRRHYISALLQRAGQQPDAIREKLEERAEAALQEYRQAFEVAREQAAELLQDSRSQFPHSAEQLQALFERGDFRALRLLHYRLQRSSAVPDLAALTEQLNRELDELASDEESALARRLRQQEAAALGAEASPGRAASAELRAGRRFRHALGRHSAERLLSRSISVAHPESGPLNPERLMLDSLKVMRGISPHYLSRFVAQVDTLFWLEQAAEED